MVRSTHTSDATYLPVHSHQPIPVPNRVCCHVSLNSPYVHSGCTLRDGHTAILDARAIQLSHPSGPCNPKIIVAKSIPS